MPALAVRLTCGRDKEISGCEYDFRTRRVFLIVIPVIRIARLALSLGGAPNSTVSCLSMTVMVWIADIYCSVRVHTTGFGSYKQLLPIFALLNLSAQVIATAG